MSRRVHNWCDVCRDTEPDIKCVNDCGRKFHETCLRTIGVWTSLDDRNDYICEDCRFANVNDNVCYICKDSLDIPKSAAPKQVKQSEDDEEIDQEEAEEDEDGESHLRRSRRQIARREEKRRLEEEVTKGEEEKPTALTESQLREMEGRIILCDGCSNSAHVKCLGLEKIPQEGDTDLWFCTECDPHSATATEMLAAKSTETTKAKVTSATVAKIGGNVDICYVCQKSGKLLGCDFCDQSFHPRCIESDYLEFEEGEKWRCPICRGDDPLKGMGHKRMSRTAMMELSRKCQECIRQTFKKCKANRDKFLWDSRHALIPFVNQKTLVRLQKEQQLRNKQEKRPPPTPQRQRRRMAIEDDDTLSEDSAVDTAPNDENWECDALRYYKSAERAACAAASAAQSNSKKSSLSLSSVPSSLVKEGVLLKGYQALGVGWLLEAFHHKAGAILADEMGLGKTIQCLAFLSGLKATGISGPHLIVVPLSTVGNWGREIRRFVPHLKSVKICGSRFERDHIMADAVASQGLYDIYITTYETVVTEEAFLVDNFNWQCLILDEAHRIKNESGRIRHSLDRVSANMRVLLTGTPLQNNIRELFTLLNFLFPEILQGSQAFQKVFVEQGTEIGTAADNIPNDASATTDIDQSTIVAVSHLLSKMMLRRTKELVVKLPKKIEHDIWLPLSSTSAYWYRKLLDVSEMAFQQQSVKKLLGTVVKMRICTCHPKGLVTRDAQLKRFKDVFDSLGEDTELIARTEQLQSLGGEDHIKASSKLIVLDKLLVLLHSQNMEVSAVYKKDYVQNVQDQFVKDNPLPPIVIPKAPGKSKSKRAAQSRLEATSSNVASSSEGGVTSDKAQVESELTGRQKAEKLRKERQAAAVAQQLDFDKRLQEAVDHAFSSLKISTMDPHFMEEFMKISKIALSDFSFPDLQNGDDDELVTPAPAQDDEAASESASTLLSPEVDVTAHDPPPVQEDGLRLSQSNTIATTEDQGTLIEESVPLAQSAPPTIGDSPNNMPSKSPSSTTKIDDEQAEDKCVAKELGPNEVVDENTKIPHKVLVFTQFQLILDELEDYCKFRGFKYLRLDGSTNKMIRELDIREFNSAQSTHLVYLICTRAGGVGINLVTANHVVLYDEDWNPFIDLQAIDRAHRIGQKREVHIWKLVTEWTVEERMAFRRMQKLKLDKLLIQANTENAQQDVDDENKHQAEKFSLEEIKRLIRYGREAIKSLTNAPEDLHSQPLEQIMQRQRKDLPIPEPVIDIGEESEACGEEVTIALEEDEELDEDARSKTSRPVSATEDAADDDEEELTVGPAESTEPVPTVSEDTAQRNEETFEELKRSRRLRRRVALIPPPLSPIGSKSKAKSERKIIHDKKCFRCGTGNNSQDEHADPLIPCHRCPRVYHMKTCLSMDTAPRKIWTCDWHECCLCFRKGSQAGGMLIHCAECPTTFCFDCFPPEYRRYNPPATYFSELSRRGYNVSAAKMVLFLCSRCKALKEQARRRLLSRQQMEAEMKKRREANLKARLDAQNRAREVSGNDEAAVALATALSKRGGDVKKSFLARKKLIDDADREQLKSIRQAYENLFPTEFIEALKQKKASQLATKQAVKLAADTAPSAEAAAPSEDAQSKVLPALGGKLVVSKLPSEYCKVCDNCRLPGHDSPQCPYPSESVRKPVTDDDGKTQSQPLTDQGNGPPTPKASHQGPGPKRITVRSFCPMCGVSARNHSRRHCDLITDEDREEYKNRREAVDKFIKELQAAERVKLSEGVEPSIANAESIRRWLQKKVDMVVINCLCAAGLSACVPSLAGNTSSKRKKRVQSDENAEASVEEDSDDNYSPRKKSRMEDGSSSAEDDIPGEDGESLRQGVPRRRTAGLVNFKELAGETKEEDWAKPDSVAPASDGEPESKKQKVGLASTEKHGTQRETSSSPLMKPHVPSTSKRVKKQQSDDVHRDRRPSGPMITQYLATERAAMGQHQQQMRMQPTYWAQSGPPAAAFGWPPFQPMPQAMRAYPFTSASPPGSGAARHSMPWPYGMQTHPVHPTSNHRLWVAGCQGASAGSDIALGTDSSGMYAMHPHRPPPHPVRHMPPPPAYYYPPQQQPIHPSANLSPSMQYALPRSHNAAASGMVNAHPHQPRMTEDQLQQSNARKANSQEPSFQQQLLN